MKASVRLVLDHLLKRYEETRPLEDVILEAFNLIVRCYDSSKLLLVCGNGGSAADSEHVLSELMKSFTVKRALTGTEREALSGEGCGEWIDTLEGALPAISLVSQTAILTAFSNDVTAESVFAQQVFGYRKQAGALLGITTSGNSENVMRAFQVARAFGIPSIALTGRDGGRAAALADVSIVVPREETFEIQELHLPVYHALCAMLETHFFLEK